MSSNAVETTAIGFTTGLRYWYWLAYAVIAINVMFAHLPYGPIAGGVLWDEVNENRLTSWDYWWWWGQSFAFYTPILTLWLMAHTWFGIYYTIHLVATVLAVAWHVVWAVMVIQVFTDCTPQFCNGDQSIMALNPQFGTKPDIFLWAYTGVVGISFCCNLFYLFFNYWLHRKTEFRMQLEVAAASRAPSLARSYMWRAQYGGARWLFDAFSPPGSQAYGSFSPYTGGASTIGADIDGHQPAPGTAEHTALHHPVDSATPQPTLYHLASGNPWHAMGIHRIAMPRVDASDTLVPKWDAAPRGPIAHHLSPSPSSASSSSSSSSSSSPSYSSSSADGTEMTPLAWPTGVQFSADD